MKNSLPKCLSPRRVLEPLRISNGLKATVRYDHTHASWKLYESPDNNVQWMDIEWTKDWEADTSQITYTNVKAGSEEFGSYITYGISDDADYDAFYTLYSVEARSQY